MQTSQVLAQRITNIIVKLLLLIYVDSCMSIYSDVVLSSTIQTFKLCTCMGHHL